ncbi:hypothetical protein RCL1_006234 [Eukaryota sp. TZLM3-RCL]
MTDALFDNNETSHDQFSKFQSLLTQVNNTDSGPELFNLTRKLEPLVELFFSHYLNETVNLLMNSKLVTLFYNTNTDSSELVQTKCSFLKLLSRLPTYKTIVPFLPKLLDLIVVSSSEEAPRPVSLASLDLLKTLFLRSFVFQHVKSDLIPFLSNISYFFNNLSLFSNLDEDLFKKFSGLLKFVNITLIHLLSLLFSEQIPDIQSEIPLPILIGRYVSQYLELLSQLISRKDFLFPSYYRFISRIFVFLTIFFKKLPQLLDHCKKRLDMTQFNEELRNLLTKFSASKQLLCQTVSFIFSHGTGGSNREFINSLIQFFSMVFSLDDWWSVFSLEFDQIFSFKSKLISYCSSDGSHSFMIDGRSKLIRLLIDSSIRYKHLFTLNQLHLIQHFCIDSMFDFYLPITTKVAAVSCLQVLFEAYCALLCPSLTSKESVNVFITETELPSFKIICHVVIQAMIASNQLILNLSELLKEMNKRPNICEKFSKVDVDPHLRAQSILIAPGSGCFPLYLSRSSSPFVSSFLDGSNVNTPALDHTDTINKDDSSLRQLLSKAITTFVFGLRLISRPTKETGFTYDYFYSQVSSLVGDFLVNFVEVSVQFFANSSEPVFEDTDLETNLNKVCSFFSQIDNTLLVNSIIPVLSNLIDSCCKHPVFKKILLELLEAKKATPIFAEKILECYTQLIPKYSLKYSEFQTIPPNFDPDHVPFLVVLKSIVHKFSFLSMWSLTSLDCSASYWGPNIAPMSLSSQLSITPEKSVQPRPEIASVLPLVIRFTSIVLASVLEQVRKFSTNHCFSLILFSLSLLKIWLPNLKSGTGVHDLSLFSHLEHQLEDSVSLFFEIWSHFPYTSLGFIALELILILSFITCKLSPNLLDFTTKACSAALTAPFPLHVQLVRAALLNVSTVLDSIPVKKMENFLTQNQPLLMNLLDIIKNPRTRGLPLSRYSLKLIGKIGAPARIVLRNLLHITEQTPCFISTFSPQFLSISLPFSSDSSLFSSINLDPFVSSSIEQSCLILISICLGSSHPNLVSSRYNSNVPDFDVILCAQEVCLHFFEIFVSKLELISRFPHVFTNCFLSSLLFSEVFPCFSILKNLSIDDKDHSKMIEGQKYLIDKVDQLFNQLFGLINSSKLNHVVVLDCLRSILIDPEFSCRIVHSKVELFISKLFNITPSIEVSDFVSIISGLSTSSLRVHLQAGYTLICALFSSATSITSDQLLLICESLVVILYDFSNHFGYFRSSLTPSVLLLERIFNLLTSLYPSFTFPIPSLSVLSLLLISSRGPIKGDALKLIKKLSIKYQIPQEELIALHSNKIFDYIKSRDLSDPFQVSSCAYGLSLLINARIVTFDQPDVYELIGKLCALIRSPTPSQQVSGPFPVLRTDQNHSFLPFLSPTLLLKEVERERLAVMGRSTMIPYTVSLCAIMDLVSTVCGFALPTPDHAVVSKYLMVIITGLLSASEYAVYYILRKIPRLFASIQGGTELLSVVYNELSSLMIHLSTHDLPLPQTAGLILSKVASAFPTLFRHDFGNTVMARLQTFTKYLEDHLTESAAMQKSRLFCLTFCKILSHLHHDVVACFNHGCTTVFQLEQAYLRSPMGTKYEFDIILFYQFLANLINPNTSILIGESLRESLLSQSGFIYFQLIRKLLLLPLIPHNSFASFWTQIDSSIMGISISTYNCLVEMIKSHLSPLFANFLLPTAAHVESELISTSRSTLCRIIYLLTKHSPVWFVNVRPLKLSIITTLHYHLELDLFSQTHANSYPALDRVNGVVYLINSLVISLKNVKPELEYFVFIAFILFKFRSNPLVSELKWAFISKLKSSSEILDELLPELFALLQSRNVSIIEQLNIPINYDCLVLLSLLFIIIPSFESFLLSSLPPSSSLLGSCLNFCTSFLGFSLKSLKEAAVYGHLSLSNLPIISVIVEILNLSGFLVEFTNKPLTELMEIVNVYKKFPEPVSDIACHVISRHLSKFSQSISLKDDPFLGRLFRHCIAATQTDLHVDSAIIRVPLFLSFDRVVNSFAESFEAKRDHDSITKPFSLQLLLNSNDLHSCSFLWISFLQPWSKPQGLSNLIALSPHHFYVPLFCYFLYFTPPKFIRDQELAVFVCIKLLSFIQSNGLKFSNSELVIKETFNFVASLSTALIKWTPPSGNFSNEILTFDSFTIPYVDLFSSFISFIAAQNSDINFHWFGNLLAPGFEAASMTSSFGSEPINLFEFMLNKFKTPSLQEKSNIAVFSLFVSLRFFENLSNCLNSFAGTILLSINNFILESLKQSSNSSYGFFTYFFGVVISLTRMVSSANQSNSIEYLTDLTIRSFDSFLFSINCVGEGHKLELMSLLTTISAGLSHLFSSVLSLLTSKFSVQNFSDDSEQELFHSEVRQYSFAIFILLSLINRFIIRCPTIPIHLSRHLLEFSDWMSSSTFFTIDLFSKSLSFATQPFIVLLVIFILSSQRIDSDLLSHHISLHFNKFIELSFDLNILGKIFIIVNKLLGISNEDVSSSFPTFSPFSPISPPLSTPQFSDYCSPTCSAATITGQSNLIGSILNLECYVSTQSIVFDLIYDLLLNYASILINSPFNLEENLNSHLFICLLRNPSFEYRSRVISFIESKYLPNFSSLFDLLKFLINIKTWSNNEFESKLLDKDTSTLMSKSSGFLRYSWSTEVSRLLTHHFFKEIPVLSKMIEIFSISKVLLYIPWKFLIDPILSRLPEPQQLQQLLSDLIFSLNISTPLNDAFFELNLSTVSLLTSSMYSLSVSHQVYPNPAVLSYLNLHNLGAPVVCISDLFLGASPSPSWYLLLSNGYRLLEEKELALSADLLLNHCIKNSNQNLPMFDSSSIVSEIFGNVEEAHKSYTNQFSEIVPSSDSFSLSFIQLQNLTEKWADTAAQLSRWDVLAEMTSSFFSIKKDLTFQSNLATGQWVPPHVTSSDPNSIFYHLSSLYNCTQQLLDIHSSVSVSRKFDQENLKDVDRPAVESSHLIDQLLIFSASTSSLSSFPANFNTISVCSNSALSSDAAFCYTTVKKLTSLLNQSIENSMVTEIQETLLKWRDAISTSTDDSLTTSLISSLRVQFLVKLASTTGLEKTATSAIAGTSAFLRVHFLLHFAQFLRHQGMFGAGNLIHQLLYHETSIDQHSAIYKTVEEIKIQLSASYSQHFGSENHSKLLNSALDILSLTNLDLLSPAAGAEMCVLRGRLVGSLVIPPEDPCLSFHSAIAKHSESFAAWFGLGWTYYNQSNFHDSLIAFLTGITLSALPKLIDVAMPAIIHAVMTSSLALIPEQLRNTLLKLDIWPFWVPVLLSSNNFSEISNDQIEFLIELMANHKYSFLTSFFGLLALDYVPYSLEELSTLIQESYPGLAFKLWGIFVTNYFPIIDQFLNFLRLFDNHLFDFSISHSLQILSEIKTILLEGYENPIKNDFDRLRDLTLALKQINANNSFAQEFNKLNEIVLNNSASIIDLLTLVFDLSNHVTTNQSVFLPANFFSFDFSQLVLFSDFHLKSKMIVSFSSTKIDCFCYSSRPSFTLNCILTNGNPYKLLISLPPFFPPPLSLHKNTSTFASQLLSNQVKRLLMTSVRCRRTGLLNRPFSEVNLGFVTVSNLIAHVGTCCNFFSIESLPCKVDFKVLTVDHVGQSISKFSLLENSVDTDCFDSVLQSFSKSLIDLVHRRHFFARSYSLYLSQSFIFSDTIYSPSSFILGQNGDFLHAFRPLLDPVDTPSWCRVSECILRVLGCAGADGIVKPGISDVAISLCHRQNRLAVLLKFLFVMCYNFDVEICENVEKRAQSIIYKPHQEERVRNILLENFNNRSNVPLSQISWK